MQRPVSCLGFKRSFLTWYRSTDGSSVTETTWNLCILSDFSRGSDACGYAPDSRTLGRAEPRPPDVVSLLLRKRHFGKQAEENNFWLAGLTFELEFGLQKAPRPGIEARSAHLAGNQVRFVKAKRVQTSQWIG